MENILQEKKIESLVHFTNVENLESILEKGLLTRKKLEDENIPFEENDSKRLDGELDSISLSVEFPNYKMFYSLIQKDSEKSWIVIAINASILCKSEAIFNTENAASSNMKKINVEDRKQKTMFEEMFEDYDDYERESLGIPENYTTNPQAEILFLDSISLEDITYIEFSCPSDYLKYIKVLKQYPHIKYGLNDKFFKPRKDWEKWLTDQCL